MEKKIKCLMQNKDLVQRLWFTIGMLFLFRLGCILPVPFIRSELLTTLFADGNIFGYLNMMGGGALETSAVFALGVSPAINASIVVQLLCVALPSLERLQRDNLKQIRKITQYVGLVMAFFMASGFYALLYKFSAIKYTGGAAGFVTMCVIIMLFVAGSQVVTWLGWQIDDHGVGNGLSLIIFAGIVSRWKGLVGLFTNFQLLVKSHDWRAIVLILLPFAAVLCVFLVTKANEAETRIPVIYSQGIPDCRDYGTKTNYIPVKLIMSGVMPIIFASTIASIPATIGMFVDASAHPGLHDILTGFTRADWKYCIFYIALIYIFNIFYIDIQFDSVMVANNLRNNGGNIPGFRPGKATSDYLMSVAHKTAPVGATILAIIAALPIIMGNLTGLPIQLGGTSVLIVCGVALESIGVLDSYLVVRHHTGFLK